MTAAGTAVPTEQDTRVAALEAEVADLKARQATQDAKWDALFSFFMAVSDRCGMPSPADLMEPVPDGRTP